MDTTPIDFTIADCTYSITVPQQYDCALIPFISGFYANRATKKQAAFSVVVINSAISLENTMQRGDIRFKSHGNSCFSLLNRYFELKISLDCRCGTLNISPSLQSAEAGALVYNSFKWFITYITLADGGLPLHSSMVKDNGGEGATLFCGPSGSGKTTISRLIANGNRALYGSDEFNAVFRDDNGWRVFPTPFVSSGGACGFIHGVSVQSVYYLRHAPEHRLRPLRFGETFFNLLRNSYAIPGDDTFTRLLFEAAERFSGARFHAMLYFKNDHSIVSFLEQERNKSNADHVQFRSCDS